MKEIRQLFRILSPLQRVIISIVLLMMLTIIGISATNHRNLQPLPRPTDDTEAALPQTTPVPDQHMTPLAEQPTSLTNPEGGDQPAAPQVHGDASNQEDTPPAHNGLSEHARERVKDESVLHQAFNSVKKRLQP